MLKRILKRRISILILTESQQPLKADCARVLLKDIISFEMFTHLLIVFCSQEQLSERLSITTHFRIHIFRSKFSMNREKANARERCRQKSIGNAFNLLRNHLPKQLRDRKPSKAETLKSATQYISHLLRILEKEMAANSIQEGSPSSSFPVKQIDYVYQKALWIPPESENTQTSNQFLYDNNK